MNRRIGIYDVDDRSSNKSVASERYIFPELRYIRNIPGDCDWTDCTLSGCEVSSGSVIMSSGYSSASIITPELANRTMVDTSLYRNVYKIQIIPHHSLGSGSLSYYASNDGLNWIYINKFGASKTTYDAIIHLPKTSDLQSSFYCLKIKILLNRSTPSDTTPTINRLEVIHDLI